MILRCYFNCGFDEKIRPKIGMTDAERSLGVKNKLTCMDSVFNNYFSRVIIISLTKPELMI